MSLAAAFGSAAIALAVGLALQPLAIRWLKHRGMMDVPNHRSSHAAITPRGGGLAVLAALLVGTLSQSPLGTTTAVLVLGTFVLGAVGLIDDLRGLRPKVRLVAQFGVGALAGLSLPAPMLALASAAACALWVASFVNAFNFMDGINGISALTALVAGISYAAMGYSVDDPATLGFGAALVGAAISFLPFNVPRAQVFLGDVGSYGLGFAIAALGWAVWVAGIPFLLAIAPAAVYLIDTGSTLMARWRRGEFLSEAHREHVYQRLTQGGWSHLRTSVFVACVQVVVISTVALGLASSMWVASLAIIVLALYWASPRIVRRPLVSG